MSWHDSSVLAKHLRRPRDVFKRLLRLSDRCAACQDCISGNFGTKRFTQQKPLTLKADEALQNSLLFACADRAVHVAAEQQQPVPGLPPEPAAAVLRAGPQREPVHGRPAADPPDQGAARRGVLRGRAGVAGFRRWVQGSGFRARARVVQGAGVFPDQLQLAMSSMLPRSDAIATRHSLHIQLHSNRAPPDGSLGGRCIQAACPAEHRASRVHASSAHVSSDAPSVTQVWKLSATDLCEIARNSVLHSGFPHQVAHAMRIAIFCWNPRTLGP